MHPKLKPFLYGLSVFAAYAILLYVLRLSSNRTPNADDFLGIYSKKDLITGLIISVLVTFMHVRRTGIK